MNCEADNLIYVIDDDAVMRLSCQQILEKEGFQVETFENGLLGLERIEQQKPSMIVVDLKMPKIGGLEVIDRVHQMDSNIIIVVITGYATVDTAVDAMKAGAYDFLPKPFTPDELRIIVRRGLERRHLIEESSRLRQEKEKMQRQFVTFVSHQLQSPLVAVQQFLDVLKHLGDTPEKEKLQKEWIDRSLIKIKHLIALIRDWLKISKIESGTFIEHISPVDLAPVIHNIIQTYQERASKRNITLKADLPEKIDTVKGTTESIDVLISNLVVNAIKYNKSGGSVTVSVEDHPDDILITVADTGIGISKENLEFIFDEFNRVKSEATEHISGTGLGLPICKKIIKELCGEIDVESELDVGSTFKVFLPKYKGEQT